MSRHQRQPWTTAQMPDQAGRRFVITGATGGLGMELTRALATAGAHVVMAVRNTGKGDEVAERVRRTGATGTVEVRKLDVADLGSVRDFAGGIDQVDVLVNNAGIMGVPFSRSVDGFELQLATNHLGHFALTNLLLDRIGDRVVAVGSMAHWTANLDLDDLDYRRRRYAGYPAYGQSKLANLLFMAHLQRLLDATGSPLRVTAGHPGFSATAIHAGTSSRFFTRIGEAGNALVGMKPSQGALPILRAATDDVPGNTYIGPKGLLQLIGRPRPVGRSASASDPDLAEALWRRSESLTGVSFPL